MLLHISAYLDLPLIATLVVLWLCHVYELDWTYNSNAMVCIWNPLKTLICLNYLFSPRRSFWSFYQVQNPLSPYIPVSDKKTFIWCNVPCNVWLCMNEMSKHSFFYLNLFHSFLFFLVSSKMWNANVMPQLYRWNTMIDLTNVICKHCALICY